jgi:hypothetical protein
MPGGSSAIGAMGDRDVCVVIAYGSGEAAHQDAPAGVRDRPHDPRSLFGLVVALSYRIDDDDYSE